MTRIQYPFVIHPMTVLSNLPDSHRMNGGPGIKLNMT
jgi:hypothetical protein